ncbi:hypothetical protein BRAS3843_970022 [Bradyrhizobium sp. STM 3843]|nr:hypothetical protein BRAS3843_970022 [Bradyrhizobium sp. STM 3843]
MLCVAVDLTVATEIPAKARPQVRDTTDHSYGSPQAKCKPIRGRGPALELSRPAFWDMTGRALVCAFLTDTTMMACGWNGFVHVLVNALPRGRHWLRVRCNCSPCAQR